MRLKGPSLLHALRGSSSKRNCNMLLVSEQEALHKVRNRLFSCVYARRPIVASWSMSGSDHEDELGTADGCTERLQLGFPTPHLLRLSWIWACSMHFLLGHERMNAAKAFLARVSPW